MKTHTTLLSNFRAAALAGTALACLSGQTAFAQSAAPAGAEADTASTADIVVTGTRIRGIAPVGAAVVQLDQQAIQATGIPSTTELLKSVPQISNLGSGEDRTGSNAGGQTFNIAQSSSINLRALGTQATLTLINGHRPAPGGVFANLFDPSAIPTNAIGNLEVLADGSSALYGSDAIAGVVNLGLRSNFTGLEVNSRFTFGDDYDAQRYSAIAGHNWGSGHAMISGEYYKSTAVAASDRSDLFLGAGQPLIKVALGNANIPLGYSNTTTSPNFTLGGTSYAANVDGTVTANRQNVFSRYTGANYLPDTKRYSVVGIFDQEITSGITFYGQGHYSRREFDNLPSRGAAGGGGDSTTALRVGASNPYLVQFLTNNALVGTPGPMSFSFLNSVGPATQSGYNTNWMAVAGVKIDLPSGFQADVSVSHGENREQRTSVTINNTALTTALNSNNAATAFNPFGATPAAVINSIRAYNDQTTGYNLTVAAAKVDGSLFALPGGDVKVAAGLEYAWNSEFIYNTATTNSAVSSAGAPIIQNTGRKMNVASAYAEVVIPVFGSSNAIPGFERLDLSAAVRYDRYNVKDCRVTPTGPVLQGSTCSSADPTFSTTNPKFGITWKPISDLTLRGSYGTSFRYNLLVSDPNGAPLYSARSYTDAVLGNIIAVLRGGGSPQVKPETASTWTLGLQYTPAWAPRLDLTATYFNIRYKNIIGNPDAIFRGNNTSSSQQYAPYIFRRPSKITAGADDTAFNALVATVTGSNFYGNASVAANTPAGIATVDVYVEQRNQNIGTIKTDGMDFTASYQFDIGATKWLLGMTGTKYFNFKRSVVTGLPLDEVAGLIDFPPEYRLRGQLGFGAGPIRSNFFINYLPSYLNSYDTSGAIPLTIGGTGTRVKSQTTVDTTFALDFGKINDNAVFRGLTLGIDIQNLLDTKPAYALVGTPATQTFDSSTSSALGQTISVRLSKKF